MGLFDSLGSAPAPNASGMYFRDGQYKVSVRRCINATSQKGAGEFFAVEGVIIDVVKGYPESNEIGDLVSHVIMAKHQSAASDVKGFIGAACGLDPQDMAIPNAVWKNAAVKACEGAGDALAGRELFVLAFTKKTRAGNDFTRILWSDVPFVEGV